MSSVTSIDDLVSQAKQWSRPGAVIPIDGDSIIAMAEWIRCAVHTFERAAVEKAAESVWEDAKARSVNAKAAGNEMLFYHLDMLKMQLEYCYPVLWRDDEDDIEGASEPRP